MREWGAMKTSFLLRSSLAILACAIAVTAAANTATDPQPRDARWVTRHESFVEIANQQTDCQALFLGDSITDGWRNSGLGVWTKNFSQYDPVNLGISGDRTQHLLWRLQNGGIGKLRPKAIVLMIGTNNTGYEPDKKTKRNTPAETAGGVRAVVAYLRAQLPASKILLLAVFPRGETNNPQRAEVGQINEIISKLHDGKAVFYLDINQKFLLADGTLPREIMPDLLHPNLKGYLIWADAIRQPLADLMK